MSKSVTRLYKSFQPENYELSLTPDAEKMQFSGSVMILGKKTGRPSKRLTLHQKGLKITSAKLFKYDKKAGTTEIPVTRINHHASFQEVRLHTAQQLYGGPYRVELEFEAKITVGMTGLYPCFFDHDGKQKKLLATQFESHHAREVFPCIDEPEAKATFDLELTHQNGLTALGNTPVKSEVPSGKNMVATTFETTPKMSSYLLAFVLGELHSKSTKTANGTEVSVWGTVAQPVNSFDFALDAAKRSIEFFEEYFKTPYPLKKADHVALPDFSSGAMENWGLITYREVVLLLYPKAPSQSTKELIATVVAHETAHQWFGNLVTMRWWDDLWLNESFANMMEYLAVDSMFPEWKIWETFVTTEGISALKRDATPGVQAVKTNVNHPDEIGTLFDPSIVYAKGGRLLYMLKSYIGDEAFRTGLQEYFASHAYANTTGADLWKSLSTSSGKDVASFMNPWLERSGFPVLSVKQVDASVSLNQHHFLDDRKQTDDKRLWPVPLFADNDKIPEVLDSRELNVKLDSKDFVLLNGNGRGHYLVHYGSESHQTFLSKKISSGNLGVIDRLMLLTDSNMLSRAGFSTYEETLVLLEAFVNEQSEPVWDIMSLIIADTKRFVDHDESVEAPLKKMVDSLITNEYKRLGWKEQADEPSSDQKLRGNILGLGIYAENASISKVALQSFDAYLQSPDAVSAEIRGIVFCAAVKHNAPGAVDALLKLHKDTNNSDLQRDIVGGLTTTKIPEVAARLLEIIKDPKLVKPQDADRWLIFLLRNRFTRDTAWVWMENNWDWIIETYKNDKSYDNFPRYAAAVSATRELEQRYRKFFEPKINETALKRNIQIGFEEINSRVTWLERDLPSVQHYFKVG